MLIDNVMSQKFKGDRNSNTPASGARAGPQVTAITPHCWWIPLFVNLLPGSDFFVSPPSIPMRLRRPFLGMRRGAKSLSPVTHTFLPEGEHADCLPSCLSSDAVNECPLHHAFSATVFTFLWSSFVGVFAVLKQCRHSAEAYLVLLSCVQEGCVMYFREKIVVFSQLRSFMS